MTADDLERLAQIVKHRAEGHTLWFGEKPSEPQAPAVWFLLDLLKAVARTAASHYSPDPDVWQQDGEIDAIAIWDTITGQNHIQPGPQAGLRSIMQPDYSDVMTPPISPTPDDGGLRY